MQHSNAANRLDRLPIGRFHKSLLVALSLRVLLRVRRHQQLRHHGPQADQAVGRHRQPDRLRHLAVVRRDVHRLAGRRLDRRPLGPQDGADLRPRSSSASSRCVSAFTWDIVSLGVCRVLTSAGLSAMTVVAVIYLSEMYPAAVRGKYQAYAIVIGICGTPATNLHGQRDRPAHRLVVAAGLRVGRARRARPVPDPPPGSRRGGTRAAASTTRADAVLRDIEEQVAAENGPLPEPAAAGPRTTRR